MSQIPYDFSAIREVCVELSKYAFLPTNLFNPNDPALLGKLDDLINVLCSQNGLKHQPIIPDAQLADYVFFPISQLLKHNIPQHCQPLLIRILRALTLNFPLWGQLDHAHFKQFLPLVLVLIGKRENIKQFEVVVKFLSSFLPCFTSFDTNDFALLAFVAQLVQLILNILEIPNIDVELRIECIDQNLFTLFSKVLHSDGEILAFISPGVISSLVRVLLGTSKNAHSTMHKSPPVLVAKILKVLGYLITTVYRDCTLESVLQSPNLSDAANVVQLLENAMHELDVSSNWDLQESSKQANSMSKKPNQRNGKWLRATRYQVLKTLQAFIPKLVKRNSPVIDSALCEFIRSILTECNQSLHVCERYLTEALLQIQNADLNNSCIKQPVVREVLKDLDLTKTVFFQAGHHEELVLLGGLKHMDKNNDNDNAILCKLIMDLCENIMNYKNSSISSKLSRKYRTKETVLHPHINMNKLKPVQEPKAKRIVEQTTASTAQMIVLSQMNEREEHILGKYFSKEMESKLKSILQNVGSKIEETNLNELLQTLFSNFDSDGMIIWVGSNLLLGNSPDISTDPLANFLVYDDEEEGKDINLLLEEPCCLVLDTSNKTLNDILNNNAITYDKKLQLDLTSSLHSISCMVDLVPHVVEEELMDLLPAIVECLTLSDDATRHYAQFLITKMAQTFTETKNVNQLIYDNISYIVDYCATKLNNSIINRCSVILSVICQLGGYEMISKFGDVLESIFEVLDYHHNPEYTSVCIEIFQLYLTIIREIDKKYMNFSERYLLSGKVEVSNDTLKPWSMTSMEQVIELIKPSKRHINLNQNNNKTQIREVDSDDEETIDEENFGSTTNQAEPTASEENERPWNSPIPQLAYKLIVQITNYGERMLTATSSLHLKTQILSCMTESIPLLATQYDSFLPQVAQSLWKIVYDMSTENVYLMEKSFQSLRMMIHYAQGFLIDRFLNAWALYQKNEMIKTLLLQGIQATGKNTVTGVSTSSALSTASHSSYPPALLKTVKAEFAKMLIEGLNVSFLRVSDVDYCKMTKIIENH